MYSKSAEYYDAIYSFKDYAVEAAYLKNLIGERLKTGAMRPTLLDVACGTGMHALHLKDSFDVTGVDTERAFLTIAKKRSPELEFLYGDMSSFDLGRQFDVVTCLFSAIGYARTAPKMMRSIANFAKHAAPGGLVIVEPWIAPEDFHDRFSGLNTVDREDLKLARVSYSRVQGDTSVLDMQYLVATPTGLKHFQETHELGLFTDADYRAAFQAAGLGLEKIDGGAMTGRGIYVGTKPG